MQRRDWKDDDKITSYLIAIKPTLKGRKNGEFKVEKLKKK